MRPQDNRSQQSSLGLCDQDCGIRQSMRKIPHSDCSLQKTLNSCPVRSTGEAPPGWRGVQMTCQGGCSCQGRLNTMGGPGQSNAQRPFLASEVTNFNLSPLC